MEALLGSHVVDKDGKQVAVSDFAQAGKVVGLYFSAHWCPPCRGFTPALAEFYDNVKKASDKLEIVFVSSDRDETSFKEYFDTMPWKALPFSDRGKKEELSTKFEVRGIPTFIILNGDTAEVVDAQGRATVSAHPDGSGCPWL